MLQLQMNQEKGFGAYHLPIPRNWRLSTRFFTCPLVYDSAKCGIPGRIHVSLGSSRSADHAEHHVVLGIGPEANRAEIKRAFRRLALKYHPDVCSSNDGHVRFLHIKAAYDSIMNPSNFGPSSALVQHGAGRPVQMTAFLRHTAQLKKLRSSTRGGTYCSST